ncbi:MAG TPA: TolC family protein [Terriglobales bacterium]|jgi:outer membrane protein TolC|nr:TolC family protein [Terriglobales bacterium]
MHRLAGTVIFVLIFVASMVATPAPQAAIQDATSSSLELLTADQAVKLALANNRDLKIVALNLDSSKDKVAAAKTRRLPSFNIYTFASQLLAPISFDVPAGQFGTFPGIGPIPAVNTPITTPSQPTAYIFGTASQPLLTLYKINLHVHGEELSMQQAVQELREERNSIVNEVLQAYYSVVEIQNVIEAKQASIKQYEELDRITLEYVSEKVVLQSDSLEVKAKLADEKLQLLQAQDKLATAKETLNNLLGRDITIDFRATEDTQLSPLEQDLKAAQATALDKNPKVKEAEIKIQQADTVRRLAKSEYIPDIGASFHYLSPFGVNFVPTNVMGLGFELSWEPFDWGRRRDTVNEKTIAVEQSKLNLAETQSQVLINVNKQFRSLQEARAAVEVASAQQEASREKLREVTDKYGQKTVLLRDVLQQQAAVEKANSDYNEAIATFWTAKANFQKAIGED